jgi:hypothetical protein
MTTDRDFDGIARAWLAEGPVELSDRVLVAVVGDVHQTRQRHARGAPWRFLTTTSPMRLAAVALVGVVAITGAFLFGRPGQPAVGGPSPIPTATASPSPTPSGSPSASVHALTETFTSPRYGYSVNYPSGWIASSATKPWLAGSDTPWGDPALDTIGTSDARLAIASQPLGGTFYSKRHLLDGQTPDEWLLAQCGSTGPTTASCGSSFLIGGQPGLLLEDGAPASRGTVATGGVTFDAAVVYQERGYEFTLDGKVDGALFEALLASVRFDPDGAIDLPPLTKTFTSPTYGYSIGLPEDFSATPATSRSNSAANHEGRDMIGTTTKLDLFVTVGSTSIPAGTTFDDWLAVQFLGRDCDVPATRKPIQIGNHVGRFSTCGNYIEAMVDVGGRAYYFSWMTQVADVHHTLADWKEVLKSVTFDPNAATP